MKIQEIIRNIVITAGMAQILGEIAMRTGGPAAMGAIASALAVIGQSDPMCDGLLIGANAFGAMADRMRLKAATGVLEKVRLLKKLGCSIAQSAFYGMRLPFSSALYIAGSKLGVEPKALGMGMAVGLAASAGLVWINGPGSGVVALGGLLSGAVAGRIVTAEDAKRKKMEKAFADYKALEKESCGKSLLNDMVKNLSPSSNNDDIMNALLGSSYFKDAPLYSDLLGKMFKAFNLKPESSCDEIVEQLKEDRFKNARTMGRILIASSKMNDSAMSEKAAAVIEKLLEKPIDAEDAANLGYRAIALCSHNIYAQKSTLSQRVVEEIRQLASHPTQNKDSLLFMIVLGLESVAASKDQDSYRNLIQLLQDCTQTDSVLSSLEKIDPIYFPARCCSLVLWAAKRMGDSDLTASLSGKWADIVKNSWDPTDRMLARAIEKEAIEADNPIFLS